MKQNCYLMPSVTSKKELVMLATSFSDLTCDSTEINVFAMQLGIRAELPRVIAMTRGLFPGDAIRVEIDDGPEVPSDRHLAIVVRSTVESVDQLVATQWKWHERLFECCPAPLTSHFRLSTESVT